MFAAAVSSTIHRRDSFCFLRNYTLFIGRCARTTRLYVCVCLSLAARQQHNHCRQLQRIRECRGVIYGQVCLQNETTAKRDNIKTFLRASSRTLILNLVRTIFEKGKRITPVNTAGGRLWRRGGELFTSTTPWFFRIKSVNDPTAAR